MSSGFHGDCWWAPFGVIRVACCYIARGTALLQHVQASLQLVSPRLTHVESVILPSHCCDMLKVSVRTAGDIYTGCKNLCMSTEDFRYFHIFDLAAWIENIIHVHR